MTLSVLEAELDVGESEPVDVPDSEGLPTADVTIVADDVAVAMGATGVVVNFWFTTVALDC